MSVLSSLFKLASYTALLGWIILIALPFWHFGHSVVIAIVVALLCAIYSYLIFFGRKYDQEKVRGSFWSLNGVIKLFKSPRVVLAGWVHYLAFDLMMGLYIVVDAARFDISHALLIPCLLLTLMLGPTGLLLYLLLRFGLTQQFSFLV